MGWMTRFARGGVFCLGAILITVGVIPAQEASPGSAPLFDGGPQDWSNRHVIYTRNGSAENMLKLRDDPRFLNSILLHYMREHPNRTAKAAPAGWNEAGSNADTTGANAQELQPLAPRDPFKIGSVPRPRNKHSKVDWSVSLGPTAGMAIGESPAVYTANYASPSCSNDFAVYTINAAPGVGTQANLVGLTNLYTNGAGTGYCSGTTPTFLFSYAIGTGGSPLSPVLSLDGTRVAWIESRTATASYLHVTIWVAGQGGTATAPVAVNGSFSSGTCATSGTSCDFALEYTASAYPGCSTAYTAGNGHSDLYVDYPSNSGFISANNGLLYHIANIFSTTISPSVDFCIPVNAGFETAPSSAMSGPVYDPLLKEVFITDSEKIYGYTVNASATPPNFSPASPASYTFGNSGSNYNYQTGPGPLLDMFNNYLYVFSTYDANGGTSVTQIPTSLASGVPVELGPESTNTNQILFYGAFDNNYYTYGPKNAASTLYSCGTDKTTTSAQDLFAISFNASTGLANTSPAMSYNTNVNPGGHPGLCSPITEFYDGTNDRIFVGMGQPGATTGANVVTMWNVNSQLNSASDTPTATSPANYLGGSSGMAADNNDSATAQAESIYFSTEEAGSVATLVPETTTYTVNGIYTDGSHFSQTGGLDDDGNAYSHTALGSSVTWNGTTFTLGTTNQVDAWQNTTVTLPSGQFSTLMFLGAAVNGNLNSQTYPSATTFTVTYTDNSTTTFTQSVSDWYTPQYYAGESVAATTAYRNVWNGTKDNRTFLLYGYSFGINPNKTVKSLTLPGVRSGTTDNVVVVLAIALTSNCGGADYCAVKLTQSGLQ